jgi:hypothetical protein
MTRHDILLFILVLLVFLLGGLSLDQHTRLKDSHATIKQQQAELDGARNDLGACRGVMAGNQ